VVRLTIFDELLQDDALQVLRVPELAQVIDLSSAIRDAAIVAMKLTEGLHNRRARSLVVSEPGIQERRPCIPDKILLGTGTINAPERFSGSKSAVLVKQRVAQLVKQCSGEMRPLEFVPRQCLSTHRMSDKIGCSA